MLRSFLIGGFECSTHLRTDGRRLDLIASTRHDARALEDYRLLQRHGMDTCRDGLRWHLIERAPGRYDWSSWLPMLRAQRATGIEIIWDLLHWGYPPDLDIWSPRFVDRFAAFARAAARVAADVGVSGGWWVAVNEMSFWSWAGGDTGGWPPFAHGRGYELKVQLARAAIAATAEVRTVDPAARFATSEPLIAVRAPNGAPPHVVADATGHHEAQYQAVDMLVGMREPQLGGSRQLVDLVGCNHYTNNQWFVGGPPIVPGQPRYTPVRELLTEAHARYRCPVFVSETGCEGSFRSAWLSYVANEVACARDGGAEIVGLCLYPVLDHAGWDDDRPCPNGLFDGLSDRAPYAPLVDEVAAQVARFAAVPPRSRASLAAVS